MKGFKLPNITIVLIAILLLVSFFDAKMYQQENRVVEHDVKYYYLYLTAYHVFDDLTLSFLENSYSEYDYFAPLEGVDGKYLSKMSMGTAVMYAPFFYVAHALAEPLGYEQDGLNPVYKFCISFGTIVYVMLGLYFLMLFLVKYFDAMVVSLVLLATVFGTNLHYYVIYEPMMSHAYNFSLIAIFAYLTDRWYDKRLWLDAVLLGLVGGLIVLTRPTNAILVLFFILYKITDFGQLWHRLYLYLKHWKQLAVVLLIVFLWWVPQSLYWKETAGSYIHFSYAAERFFFDHPYIFQGLFGFRSGWLLYTPVMLFAVMGMFLMWKHKREFFFPVVVYFCVSVYVLLSWWSWWYGGGLSIRAFVDFYGIMAIPMAVSLSMILQSKPWLKWSMLFLIVLFIAKNQHYIHQYRFGMVHYDGNTKKSYNYNFFRVKPGPDTWKYYESPDYVKAKKYGRQDVVLEVE